ncbi:MAG: glycosyltransferase family 2 protein [Patescibacteria group bacterium]
MKFSVVIPAFNEEDFVATAVASLKKQNFPRADFEIIVVDNNSTDKTSEVAKKAGADIVVVEIKQGTNLARQRGVLESKGEIVAFLDADSEAPTDWLEHLEKNLSEQNIVVTSGPYDHSLTGLKKTIDYLYTRFVIPNLPPVFNFLFGLKTGMIIEGNFAAWRWAIDKIGGLPPLKFYGDGAAIAMLLTRRVGNLFFDPTLNVKSSVRRLEKEGFVKTPLKYAFAWLKIYFSKDYR